MAAAAVQADIAASAWKNEELWVEPTTSAAVRVLAFLPGNEAANVA